MRHFAVVGLIVLASLAGCSHVRPGPSTPATDAQSAPSPRPPDVASASPSPLPQPSPAAAAAPAVVESTPAAPSSSGAAPASRSAVDRTVPPPRPAASAPGAAGTPTAATVARPAPTAAPKAAPTAAAPDKPAAPPSLDLTALEQRLRDTRAIGVFTKLSLKNQVDDLLGQFRAYYRGQRTVPPPELRQRYDGLLMKVLSVLQDGDPPLAAQIWSSREAIWGVLADPAKFEKI